MHTADPAASYPIVIVDVPCIFTDASPPKAQPVTKEINTKAKTVNLIAISNFLLTFSEYYQLVELFETEIPCQSTLTNHKLFFKINELLIN